MSQKIIGCKLIEVTGLFSEVFVEEAGISDELRLQFRQKWTQQQPFEIAPCFYKNGSPHPILVVAKTSHSPE